MWIEYSIPASFETQKEIIRQLRTWIEGIEEQELIQGFAFDHYFGTPNVQDELRIRFDYPHSEDSEARNQLGDRVRARIPSFSPSGRPWVSNAEVLKAYEFGSRCAFLFWDMESRGRFPEDYLSNFITVHNQQSAFRVIPFNFQFHFNHGVMNSFGVPKLPNEQFIHLLALIESTQSGSPDELCEWIRRQPSEFFQFLGSEH